MDPNAVTVRIGGKEISLTGSDHPEQTRRAAEIVDMKMRELMANGKVRWESAALMAALLLAQEVTEAQQDNARLRRMLDENADKNT